MLLLLFDAGWTRTYKLSVLWRLGTGACSASIIAIPLGRGKLALIEQRTKSLNSVYSKHENFTVNNLFPLDGEVGPLETP